jgi:ribonuclease P protein component
VYAVSSDSPRSPRFGFIVAKSAGGAVVRNRIRRRLRAASFELLDAVPEGTDIVVRGLAGSEALAWDQLVAELRDAIRATTVSA